MKKIIFFNYQSVRTTPSSTILNKGINKSLIFSSRRYKQQDINMVGYTHTY